MVRAAFPLRHDRRNEAVPASSRWSSTPEETPAASPSASDTPDTPPSAPLRPHGSISRRSYVSKAEPARRATRRSRRSDPGWRERSRSPASGRPAWRCVAQPPRPIVCLVASPFYESSELLEIDGVMARTGGGRRQVYEEDSSLNERATHLADCPVGESCHARQARCPGYTSVPSAEAWSASASKTSFSVLDSAASHTSLVTSIATATPPGAIKGRGRLLLNRKVEHPQ